MWFRVRTLVLIFLLTIINYLDRSAISFAISPMESELDLTHALFGWIAAGFGFGFFGGNFFSGWFVDRFGSVKIWGAAAALWALISIFIGAANGFWTLFLLRVALGGAESVHYPSLLKTNFNLVSSKKLARSIALSICGLPIAMIVGSPLIAWIIDSSGWRPMFYCLGAAGFLWVIFWFWSFLGHKAQKAEMPPMQQLWKTFFRSKAFKLSCVVYFSFGYTLFFATIWLPGYLQQTFSLSLTHTGLIAAIPWIIGGLCLYLGGLLSDLILQKTGSLRYARSFLIGLGLSISAFSFLLISHVQTLPLAIFLFSLGLGGNFLLNAPIYALNADLFPSASATAQSIIGIFFALAGILAPAVTGIVSQLSGSFLLAFYLVALISLIGAIFAFCQKPLEE